MANLVLCLTYLAIFSACTSVGETGETVSEKPFEFPAEWERHAAVWTDLATDNGQIYNDTSRLQVIRHLAEYVHTKVVYDDDSLRQAGIEWLIGHGADTSNIRFIHTSGPMNWVRDPGPVFLTDGQSLKLADFKWMCYAEVYDCANDGRGEIDNELANGMAIPVKESDIFLEGGGIDVSGDAIMAYRVMADHRNPDKSLEEVENALLDILGKEKMIWLTEFPLLEVPFRKTENYFGNGANGHIDAFTRFLNDTTILHTVISEEDKDKNPVLRRDYEILQSNLAELRNTRRPDGKPYHIELVEAPDYSLYQARFPMPQYMYDNFVQSGEDMSGLAPGDTIVWMANVEYANFLITNGLVLGSKFWKSGMPESERRKDENARKILDKYFPDRDVILLDVLPINWGGGGIHCRTQQEPVIPN